jgi:hypothetical protein
VLWRFRNTVQGCILATDFARHARFLENARWLEAVGLEERPLQLEMELIIKAADISNVVKPFAVARRWALRVTDDFFMQGDVERERGMDVTPSCDRFVQSRVALQKGLIDHVTAPYFAAISRVFPSLARFEAQMKDNNASWELLDDAALEESRDWDEAALEADDLPDD